MSRCICERFSDNNPSDDVEEREAFRADQGEYLPSDIWPGLVNAPTKLEIRAVDAEEGSIPELSKDVIEAAARRAKDTL